VEWSIAEGKHIIDIALWDEDDCNVEKTACAEGSKRLAMQSFELWKNVQRKILTKRKLV